MNKILEDMLKSIESYKFKEAGDNLIFMIGYLQEIDEFKPLLEILKKIYDLIY